MKMFKALLTVLGNFSFIIDIAFLPLAFIASIYIRLIKFIGLKKFKLTKNMFNIIGVFPIVKHYYEPQYDFRNYRQTYRELPGIDFNDEKQLEELRSFSYQDEILKIPLKKSTEHKFYFENGAFSSGDAECYYSLIRKYKPSRIIEVGSGYSTLIAYEAVLNNCKENELNNTKITCIEPYEMPWLAEIDVELIRKKVEDIDLSFFEILNKGDILFIDSSHVIRPQGDVLFEIMQILPKLNSGVLIHFHDIFTPFNYPESWLKNEYRLWNEQYLLEAFLSFNKDFEILIAMSYLNHHNKEQISNAFPVLEQTPNNSAGSFWLRKK